MQRHHTISTVFTAVNSITAPIRAMTQQFGQFSRAVRFDTNTANAALRSTGTSVQHVHRQLQQLNHISFSRLNASLRATGRIARQVASAVTPGMGALAVAGVAGFGAAAMLKNSAGYESIENITKGLLYDNAKLKKIMTLPQMNFEAVRQGRLQEAAGNSYVGQFKDYANIGAASLARGILPDKAFYDAVGAIAAVMPNVEDQGGQMLEVYKSLLRGEMALADNIAGVKGHIDKSTHEAYLMKNGRKFELGAPDAKNYTQRLNDVLLIIAKDFAETGKLQGKSFEAKSSTLFSTFSRGMDDMIRKTSWWEGSIKPAMDFITAFIKNATAKITEFSQALYDKFAQFGARAGDLASMGLNKVLDWMTNMVKSIDQTTLNNFGAWLDALPWKIHSAYTEGIRFANEVLPRITEALQIAANAINSISSSLHNIGIGPGSPAQQLMDRSYSSWSDYARNIMKTGNSQLSQAQWLNQKARDMNNPLRLVGGSGTMPINRPLDQPSIMNNRLDLGSLYGGKNSNVVHLQVNNHAQPNGGIKTTTQGKGQGLRISTNTGKNARGYAPAH
jgi:hypothetical protein